MRALHRSSLLVALALVAACTRGAPSTQSASAQAPVAATRSHQVPSPFGAREDEYYWLRDDARSDPDVLSYLRAEDAYTDRQLAPLSAAREVLAAEMVARIAPEDSSAPVREHGYWYWHRFAPQAEYAVHMRRRDQPGAPEQVVLDENELARGHGYFHLGGSEVSPSGRLLAWAEDRVGRGQHVIRFKNLDTGELLPDTLQNAEESLAWAADDSVLLYVEKDPETLLGTRVHAHRLGSEPTQDKLVYEEKDHTYYLAVWRARSGRYVNIYSSATDSSEQWVARSDDPALSFQRLIAREPRHEYVAEDAGERWIVRTNRGAPNFRLIEASTAQLAQPESWRVLVGEPSAGLIEDFSVFDQFLAYVARDDGLLAAYVQPFGSAARRIELPGQGYTVSLGDNPEPESQTLRLEYTSLTTPDSVYDYDTVAQQLTLKKREPVLGGFDPERFESEQLRVTSRDGTSIPVTLAHRKGVARDRTAPLYQLGYGAYGVSDDPEFSSARVSLLERGVVLAIAHVRGGQELGRSWYEAGRQQHKRNTFHDFIDVTQQLVAQGIASPRRVAARGASAGGLLIGAVANLAPEAYAVLVANVPFVDVVTTMLDESIPLTSNEYDEWGDPRREADYRTMLSYSPYDNVQRKAYPALFVSTSLWDSQVQYYEPAKWVARLRARKTDHNPLLFRVHMQGSHGGVSGRFARQRDLADEYAFVLSRLGVRVDASAVAPP